MFISESTGRETYAFGSIKQEENKEDSQQEEQKLQLLLQGL